MLLCCFSFLAACKNTTNNESAEDAAIEATSVTEIQAEFIYIQDAAVLKGQSFIYGVVLDEKAKELAKKVKSFKKDQYDMVPVVVRGIIRSNPVKDGWKEVVEIKEIVKVLPVKKAAKPEAFKVSVNE